MKQLSPHLFPSSDGALYDTRVVDWHKLPPLRPLYNRHTRKIETVADLKATLRAGPLAWPGRYPLFFLCDDGGVLCFKCARTELRQIVWSIAKSAPSGWRIVACDINHEDRHLHCEHCGDKIAAAYTD